MRMIERLVRKAGVVALGAAMVVAATGCWVQPPPAPVVTEATVSPDPVVAGSSFTFTLSATNVKYKIFGVILTVKGPAGAELRYGDGCPAPPHFDSALEVHVSVECTIPAGAPNGTWTVTARINNEAYSWVEEIVPFEVVGGSTDVAPPQLTRTVPATVAPGSAFDVVVRAVDEHGPVILPDHVPLQLTIEQAAGGVERFSCRPGAWTQVDATTFDYTTTCDVPADQRPGTYDTWGWNVYDRFGQSTPLDLTIAVV